jgi:hypothetical protein
VSGANEDMTMHTPKFYDLRDNNAISDLSLSMPPTLKIKTKLAPTGGKT